MDGKNKKASLKAQFLQRLHKPFQLQMMLTALVMVIGYSAVYWPHSNDIAETQNRLSTAQKRLRLARDIELLRTQFKRCQPRLTEKPDANEWVQYLLSGLRKLPVQVHTMEFKPLKEVGPYKAIALRIEVEGSFDDLHAVLSWLETNERLFRVDSVSITPRPQGHGTLMMELIILGMMG